MSIDVRESPPIRRKDEIPEEHRTEDRDKAAETIDEFIERGKWEDASKTAIADEAGYSRQHIDNVLQHYYEVIPEDERDEDDENDEEAETIRRTRETEPQAEQTRERNDGRKTMDRSRQVRGPGEGVIDFDNMSKAEIFSAAYSMGHDKGFDKGYERGRQAVPSS